MMLRQQLLPYAVADILNLALEGLVRQRGVGDQGAPEENNVTRAVSQGGLAFDQVREITNSACRDAGVSRSQRFDVLQVWVPGAIGIGQVQV